MKNYKRCFLAIPLSAELSSAIDHWRQRVCCHINGRSVPAQNFHLTLAFLGTLTDGQIAHLKTNLSTWLLTHPAPNLSIPLNHLGYFKKAGILWIGPEHPDVQFLQWADILRNQCVNWQLMLPGQFRPHMTLFRNYKPRTENEWDVLDIPEFRLAVTSPVLFESVVSDQGVVYQPLFSG